MPHGPVARLSAPARAVAARRGRWAVAAITLLWAATVIAGAAYHVNPTGETYHQGGCRFVTAQARQVSLQEAAAARRPCRACRPPRPGESTAPASTAPVPGGEQGKVVRILDGDTLQADVDGRLELVRLIGVDAPETKDPRQPVQEHGRAAAAYAKGLTLGQVVRLERDPGTADRDRFGRLLRYAWLGDGRLVNAEIVRQGYGHAYVEYPFDRMKEFRGLEQRAREDALGLWEDPDVALRLARPPPAGSAPSEAVAPRPEPAMDTRGAAVLEPGKVERRLASPAPAGGEVYVTRTGSKYHAAGCRHLRKSAIAVSLEQARASGYGACSACSH